MESYQDLKNKWRRRLEQGTASHNFDLDKLAPGKFCVLYSDFGGSMACHSSTEVVGVFEDARGQRLLFRAEAGEGGSAPLVQ